MMRIHAVPALLLCLVPAVAAASPAAESDPPSPRELREQMMPVYQELQTDAKFLELKEELEGNLGDPEALDRYLEYLPISPLLMHQIERHLNHHQTVIPRVVAKWHVRWIELHESEARKMYGDAHVDAKLDRGGESLPTLHQAASGCRVREANSANTRMRSSDSGSRPCASTKS
ncbi:MAG: hypothetical protein GY856_05005 [bacterium]|nr:hypothetical protein [bacterium]